MRTVLFSCHWQVVLTRKKNLIIVCQHSTLPYPRFHSLRLEANCQKKKSEHETKGRVNQKTQCCQKNHIKAMNYTMGLKHHRTPWNEKVPLISSHLHEWAPLSNAFGSKTSHWFSYITLGKKHIPLSGLLQGCNQRFGMPAHRNQATWKKIPLLIVAIFLF